ncbi:probable protein phosphatase 2C 40 [Macadamia integrifolia]|uniref:probable protein phosphatase 2C 40 n=1 Tax=Macadamia integrifolia TaxID=60698 RepID=UPI001C4F41FF|nr:probable protein phosphatase 2C 40 [Macadamia integrifolia]XP_042498892.1 probable protein phosphatase 2C 40 [Macadamia integrifolia]XP_042498894.1 probable protein phosphatase 2C 40 [Macadamia integrifolia]XP_042498895.1 probable protein phosphatase 2C 40 [Macadamia integrifolia]
MMRGSEEIPDPTGELSVSFGYQCSTICRNISSTIPNELEFLMGIQIEDPNVRMRSSSFSCLSGAALGANATLANTNICNGLIGEEILPGLDSPKSFRRMASSPTLSRLDPVSSSSQSSLFSLSGSLSMENDIENIRNLWKPMSASTRIESSSFLNAMDVQMAGGAAGEDRVQAVCSEENGWLFCGVYDGFNGRDAADFLAGTLYENIGFYLHLLDWRTRKERCPSKSNLAEEGTIRSEFSITNEHDASDLEREGTVLPHSSDVEVLSESFRLGVIDCLSHALAQAESDFMYMVEQEMEERPDLVSVGSCVLVVLLHEKDLYILNIGDSRAVLATSDAQEDGLLKAIQLTETHTVDNEVECKKVLADHPDDPSPIVGGRVKGKLKLTRAFGVGYLKKSKMNEALMGILRVRNLCSPPYVYTHPFTNIHRVSDNNKFVVLGSDGLFDFFSNDEVVQLVHLFIQDTPSGDPAKHLVEQLVLRAAENAGFSTEDLLKIPAGRRRKYHDDVTVIVIILGNRQRTLTASTSL